MFVQKILQHVSALLCYCCYCPQRGPTRSIMDIPFTHPNPNLRKHTQQHTHTPMHQQYIHYFILNMFAPSRLSHHLSPRHGILLVSRVPVSKIVHVSSRVHRRPFGGHADVPQRAWRGGGWRRWGGKVFSFKSTWPVLHDLLVFGSFILEPYLHLDTDRERKENN